MLIEKFNTEKGLLKKSEVNNGIDHWLITDGISYPLTESKYNHLKSRLVVSKSKIGNILDLERGIGYYSRYDGDEVAHAISLAPSLLFDGAETKKDKIDKVYDEIYYLLDVVKSNAPSYHE